MTKTHTRSKTKTNTKTKTRTRTRTRTRTKIKNRDEHKHKHKHVHGQSKTRRKIGEGTYGCVHYPSLKCEHTPSGLRNDGKPFSYKSYISKLMTNKHAKSEISDLTTIDKYDMKDKFHIGHPIVCQPHIHRTELPAIKECHHIEHDEVKKNPSNYKLMLLRYGGYDLKQLCIKHLQHLPRTTSWMDMFWIQVRRLFVTLQFLRKIGHVHYDIKPQNVVFHPKTMQFKLIDFGLMGAYKDLEQQSKASKNSMGDFHWSYPLDVGFMNRRAFNTYMKLSANQRIKEAHKWAETIIDDKTPEKSSPFPAFRILFAYLQLDGKEPPYSTKYEMIHSFFQGLNQVPNYDWYLTHTLQSIDVYGLGFTLQYMLNHCFQSKRVTVDFYIQASALFRKMYTFQLMEREVRLDVLLEEYDKLLFTSEILQRRQSIPIVKQILQHMKHTQPLLATKMTKSRHIHKDKTKGHILPKSIDELSEFNIIEMKQNR